jgi:lambda family phage portal protein
MMAGIRQSIANLIWPNQKATPKQSSSTEQRDIATLQRIVQQNISRRHYDAGSTNRIRDDWPVTSSIPYTDIKPNLSIMIARSRREIDNNGIANAIRRTIVNNVWGEGPIFQAQVKDDAGEPVKKINDELEYAWERHCEELDATGISNFSLWGGEALDCIITSGTVLINRVQAKKGSFLNLAYQMLEPDILDTSKDDQKLTTDQNKPERQVLHGIGIDDQYKPVKYYIKGINEPISAEFMHHFYRRTRPNQVIGVPWLHASLPDLFDYRQLKEDTLVKSRLLADIALWSDPTGDLFSQNVPKNSDDEALWEPGMWIKSRNKPEVIQAEGDLNAALKPLLNRVLLDACCGSGTSYMAVSRDMDGVNFAASRANLNEDHSGYKVFRNFMKFQLCQYHYNNFVRQCVLQDKVSITPSEFLRDQYRFTKVLVQFPAWDWVDPRADSAAMVSMREAGLNNLNDSCGKRGIDWREYIDQVVTELEYMNTVVKGRGVTIDELKEFFNKKGVQNADNEQKQEENSQQ